LCAVSDSETELRLLCLALKDVLTVRMHDHDQSARSPAGRSAAVPPRQAAPGPDASGSIMKVDGHPIQI